MLQSSLQDTLRLVQEQKEVHEGFASQAAAALRQLQAEEKAKKVQSLLAGMPCKLLQAQSFSDASRTRHQLVWDIGAGMQATCTCESAHAEGVDPQPATMELSCDLKDSEGVHAVFMPCTSSGSWVHIVVAVQLVRLCMLTEVRSQTCCG